MKKCGEQIVIKTLELPITAKVYQTIEYPDHSKKNVRGLLEAKKYLLPTFENLTAPTKITWQPLVRPFDFTDLKSAFTANVSLQKLRVGTRSPHQSPVDPDTQIDFFHYVVGELLVNEIWVSDKDRAKTTGSGKQFSHIVAWTLQRNAIFARLSTQAADRPRGFPDGRVRCVRAGHVFHRGGGARFGTRLPV